MEYNTRRATDCKSTSISEAVIVREIAKKIVKRSEAPVTEPAKLIKALVAKMKTVLQNFRKLQCRKNFDTASNVFIQQLKSKYFDLKPFMVTKLPPKEPENPEELLARFEPEVQSQVLEVVEARRNHKPLPGGRNYIQLNDSRRLYLVELPVTKSGRSYIDFTRTIQGAKTLDLGDHGTAYITNCVLDDVTILTEDNQDAACDRNRVSI